MYVIEIDGIPVMVLDSEPAAEAKARAIRDAEPGQDVQIVQVVELATT